MSFALDVNVLLYASDVSSPQSGRAVEFLESCAAGPEVVCVAWPTVMSYLRLATHPSIFSRPLSPEEAMGNVEALLRLPHVRTLGEEDGFWAVYREVAGSTPTRGNLVPGCAPRRAPAPARRDDALHQRQGLQEVRFPEGPEPVRIRAGALTWRSCTMTTSYTAKDITVLEGLDPVRKRPGMYIGGVGSAGLHHLVWEIVDNAIDEAMNGYASSITLVLHADGSSITVTDDGRGIPVDKHPQTKKSALEVIFTMLHAGGKFGQGSYKTAGGLHGVGASVVNALSKELVATVKRDGAQWEQRFKQGKPVGPIKRLGAARGTGTTVYFHPDPTIFPKIEFEPAVIRERLEVASYLHKGLTVVFDDQSNGKKETFEHAEGLVDFARKLIAERGAQAGPRGAVHAVQGERPAGGAGPAVDRGDRRAGEELRERHPDRVGRDARERSARRASARRSATTSRRTPSRPRA